MSLQAIRTALIATALVLDTAHAQTPKAAPPEQAVVYTRATVQSVFVEDARHYIRLKLGPGSGLPFRTLTFRVRDPAQVAAFTPGMGVEFIAARVGDENTLTALRAAPGIKRFESH
ncbi:copper-binding protein [Pseudorhodoferax sp. Leaf267]|uniref:copper-binding protein n=1 Tax=Pseudorhodoferax sp. Leaf267 TaxID=1736316 RepID=UPI0006F6BC5D|nr:copper-binding protein [Pseudorhodoferax sp. Leaf267]KQP22782.1 hypothetical protein ASF43_02480 [Pseudorhodoferax sp. Leaf267]